MTENNQTDWGMYVCSNKPLYDVRGPKPWGHESMLPHLMVHKVEVHNHLFLLPEVVCLMHLLPVHVSLAYAAPEALEVYKGN